MPVFGYGSAGAFPSDLKDIFELDDESPSNTGQTSQAGRQFASTEAVEPFLCFFLPSAGSFSLTTAFSR